MNKRKKLKRNKLIKSDEKKYIDNIREINNKINSLSDSDYIKFRDYSTRFIDNISKEIKRKHFKDRTDFSLLKENSLAFIFKKFFEPINSTKILLKEDNYNYIEKSFNNEGKVIINKLISALDNCIVNRNYDPIDEASIYNEETFNDALSTLGIDNSIKRITFSFVRECFEKKKEFAGGNKELKDKINNAFITIRNQYSDYLNKTKLINKEE